jgi:hypothetical protein
VSTVSPWFLFTTRRGNSQALAWITHNSRYRLRPHLGMMGPAAQRFRQGKIAGKNPAATGNLPLVFWSV